MPLSIDEIEQRARQQVGLFAKPEPPSLPPSMLQKFAGEALPEVMKYLQFVGAPGGLGLSGARIGPLARPSAPLSAAPRIDSMEALRRLNTAYEPPLSSPAFLRGLTDEQRRAVQGLHSSGMSEPELRDTVRELQLHNKREMGGQPSQRQFDINNFREPQRPTAPASPGPGYGEQGNFMAPTIPGGFKPPALTDRLAQIPNPARRDLPSEMPIGEVQQGRHDWGITYEPGGDIRGQITATVNPRSRDLQIAYSNLPKSAQGKGIGQEMYRRLIDKAHEEGFNVSSDSTLSPYSNRIYEDVLRGQGYDIQRNPQATRRAGGRYPHQTPDESGVYIVGPKERLPAPSLMDMLMRVPKNSPYAIAPLGLGTTLMQPEDR